MIGCMICGQGGADSLYRFAPKGIVGVWLCPVHRAEVLEIRGVNYELMLAIYDAPSAILDAALLASRTSKSPADRAWRRRQREERAAIATELKVGAAHGH